MCIYCDAYEEDHGEESQPSVEPNHSEPKATSPPSKGVFEKLRSSIADLL
ncbi:hypothetical protein NDO74_21595 [Haloferax sp. S2CR25-2]|nr:hypothetical protein [Haloferax sp. S2CR25]MDS0447018.1 hypothetical protein [Haloferax sp. S2CR25-2]